MNKNGCTLPKEEVEKSLGTLVGKAIDFDHLRKRVVGFWLDAKVEKDAIIAYGAFFKSNFSDDYTLIKDLMENATLAISFEAWGERIAKEDGSYDLKDIVFAGGALLIKTQPAFPGSQVMELAKHRVLEFASLMTKPESFVRSDTPKAEHKMEFARFYISDIESIMRMIYEVECPVCSEKGFFDMQEIDFMEGEGHIECINCMSKLTAKFTPSAELENEDDEKEKEDSKIHKPLQLKSIKADVELAMFEDFPSFVASTKKTDIEIETIISKDLEESTTLSTEERMKLDDDMFAFVYATDKQRKIRMFPIHDSAHTQNALLRLAQAKVQQIFGKLGISIDNVKRKILIRAKGQDMKELMEKYQKATIEEVIVELAKETMPREMTVEEIASMKTKIEAAEKIDEEIVKSMIVELSNLVKAEIEKAAIEKTKADLVAANEKIATLEAEVAKYSAEFKKIEDAKIEAEKAKVAATVKSRRDELGEWAKEMKDEDVLDEVKFELAKLKKENAELKASGTAPKIVKGSLDKTEDTETKGRAKVDELAWGRRQ